MKWFITLASLTFIFTAYANAGDGSPWSGKIKTGGLYMKGNTDKFYISSGGQLMFRKGIVESIVSASWTYGESDRLKDDNDIGAAYTLDIYYYNIWSPFVLQFIEHSFARNIDLRSQSGGGIKYTFVPFPKYKSSLSAACLFDYTDYEEVPGYTDRKKIRISARLKSRLMLFDDLLTLSHITFYQPSVKEIKDRIWRSETSLEVKITEIFSFITTYKYHYEYFTLNGGKRHDHEVDFAIGLEFK